MGDIYMPSNQGCDIKYNKKACGQNTLDKDNQRVDLQVDLKQSPLRSTLMMASTWSTFTSTVGQEICALLVPRLPSTLETVLQARLLRFQLTVPTTGIGLLDALKGR